MKHHRHNERLQYVIERIEIGTDHAIPLVTLHRGKGIVGDYTRIKDDTIESPSFLDITVKRGSGLFTIRDIEKEHVARSAEVFQFSCGFTGLVERLYAMHNRIVPCFRKVDGDCAADAAA